MKAMTNHGEILVYQTNGGAVRLDVRLHDDTAWLIKAMRAELVGTSVPNISMHLCNIFDEDELSAKGTV